LLFCVNPSGKRARCIARTFGAPNQKTRVVRLEALNTKEKGTMQNTKESHNVITIPHGGITANEAKDARDTLCRLLDCIESNGVQNARITQADESAIRTAVKVLGAIVNGDETKDVIRLPHTGIVADKASK
jgi:hypothetical protein